MSSLNISWLPIQYNFITIIGGLNNNLLLPKYEVNKHFINVMNSHTMKNITNVAMCFKTSDVTL